MTGFLTSLFERPEKRSDYAALETALYEGRAGSGVSVTQSSAMRNSAVFACVRILAETLASLPLIIYRRDGKIKTRAQDYYLYRLLHDEPNELMTAFELIETMQGHLAGWGNAYCWIDYDERGRVASLWPLNPANMLDNEVRNGERVYQYMLPNGKIEAYRGVNVWHLRGLGSDGLNGYSVIGMMRHAIGLGMAAEEFGSRFFANDARPGVVLEHPGVLSKEAHDNLKKSWGDEHEGLSKSHKVAILEEGLKLHEIGIPPEDAQFLETRKFQVTEIARAFRIPPHMLADLDRATFSNIEQQSLEFVQYTLMPWMVRWEKSIRKNLMMESEKADHFAEFLAAGLLRGDTPSRYQAYATGRQNGWLSANDVRELENMNPIEGGDVYLIPLNMVPAGSGEDYDQSMEDEPQEDEIEEPREDIHWELMRAAIRMLDEPERQQPVPNITVNVPERKQEIHVSPNLTVSLPEMRPEVRVDPQQVTVNVPEQKTPDVVVNVEAPQVTVTNEVPQPKVEINTGRTVGIIRDAAGRVAGYQVMDDEQ